MAQNVVQCTTDIAAPVQRVWALMSEPVGIRRWYAFDDAQLDPVPGGAVIFEWEDHGTHHGAVEQVTPGTLIAFRLALVPDASPEPGNSTLVEWHVEGDADLTRVRIVETGFTALDGSEADRDRHVAAETEGWDSGLALLKKAAEEDAGS